MMKTDYNTRRAYIDLIQDTTRPNTFKIAMIYTAVSARREGLATDLLREVCADADREGVTITLAVVPEQTGGKAPNVAQLWNWYAKHGFVEMSSHIGWPRMIRPPRPSKPLQCAECTCTNPPEGCNWIKTAPPQPGETEEMLKPSNAPGLYSQMFGRILREHKPLPLLTDWQPARIPNFPIMRVVESDGAVSWLDGHNEQDAFETFGPDISIAFMWGRVK